MPTINELELLTNTQDQVNSLTLSIQFSDQLTEHFSEIDTFLSFICSQFEEIVIEYSPQQFESNVVLSEALESLLEAFGDILRRLLLPDKSAWTLY